MSQVAVSLRGRALRAVLVWALYCAVSRAQTPAPAAQPAASPAPTNTGASAASNTAEVSSHDAPVTFSTKVNLVSVPVVVRDRQGHALGTLNREDFQLFDRGKLQVITKFSVERSGTPAIPGCCRYRSENARNFGCRARAISVAEHFIAYLFDDVHLNAEDLSRVRMAAQRHLAGSLDSTTRAAIYTTSGLGSLDFTDDRRN